MCLSKRIQRSLVCGLVVGTFLFGVGTPARAHESGFPFSAVGETSQQVPGQGPFEGFATVEIGPAAFDDVAVTTVLLGEPKPLPSGALLARTSHTFDFAELGSFTTIDRAVLRPADPPCIFRLHTVLRIDREEGNGFFEEARGTFLVLRGEIDLCVGQANWEMRGPIHFEGQPTAGIGQTEFSFARERFEGLATLTIGLRELEAEVVTVLIEPGVTSHTFTMLPDQHLEGSFTTMDEAILIPTSPPCEFDLESVLVIESGTGDFEEAGGILQARGEIRLPDPACDPPFVATWALDGIIAFDD